MTEKYDAIVVGTGQSGPSLAARLAGAAKFSRLVATEGWSGPSTFLKIASERM